MLRKTGIPSRSNGIEAYLHHLTDRSCRPQREHTDIEEELHEVAHIDYNRVSIVRSFTAPILQDLHAKLG